jgi:hypothetical protein
MSDESPDLHDDLILQRLEWSVRALAQPAAVQRTLFPDVVGAGEELALEFEQWFREIRESLGISDVGYRCLDRLDEQLTHMTAQDDEDLWFDDDTLARSADWATIRALAKRTLIAMGWSSEPPPAERDTYVAAPSKPAEPSTLVDVVREYAALQSRLVADLLAAHPAVVTEDNSQRWPRNGVLHSGGADWHFRCHGLGYRLRHLGDGTIVEAHERLTTAPDAIDAMRIREYLQSRRIRVRHGDARLPVEHDAIAAALADLARRRARRRPSRGVARQRHVPAGAVSQRADPRLTAA